MSKTATTSKNATTTRSEHGNARAVSALTWSAAEYVPHRRWWWFVTVAWLTLTLSPLAFVIGSWPAALLTLLIGVACFALYLPKPRVWQYRLEGKTLTARFDRDHLPDIELLTDLDDYRAFSFEHRVVRKNNPPLTFVVLLPKRRLGLTRDIYLPEEEEKAMSIIDRVNRHVLRNDDGPPT